LRGLGLGVGGILWILFYLFSLIRLSEARVLVCAGEFLGDKKQEMELTPMSMKIL